MYIVRYIGGLEIQSNGDRHMGSRKQEYDRKNSLNRTTATNAQHLTNDITIRVEAKIGRRPSCQSAHVLCWDRSRTYLVDDPQHTCHVVRRELMLL